jgi:hypothetical protein
MQAPIRKLIKMLGARITESKSLRESAKFAKTSQQALVAETGETV